MSYNSLIYIIIVYSLPVNVLCFNFIGNNWSYLLSLDLVTAHKCLLKEKEVLESSLKAFSKSSAPKSNDFNPIDVSEDSANEEVQKFVYKYFHFQLNFIIIIFWNFIDVIRRK